MEPEEGSDNVEETSTCSPSKYLKRLPRLSDLVAKKQEPHPGPRGRHGHKIEVLKAPPSVQPRKLSLSGLTSMVKVTLELGQRRLGNRWGNVLLDAWQVSMLSIH